jgi:hypothetical protein
MRKRLLLAASASTLAFFAASPARAGSFSAAFPAAGASYLSQTEGSGTLPAGGSSTNGTRTAGDYIQQSFSGTGLASVSAFSDTFSIVNSLGGNEKLAFLINGTSVGSLTVLSGGGGANQTYTFNSGSFKPIIGGGLYTLAIQLQTTLPFGGGSIQFLDGGAGVLTGVALPATVSTVTVAFPAAGTSYLSQTEGSGQIPTAGSANAMWTAGDYVRQSVSGTGLASVFRLSDTF